MHVQAVAKRNSMTLLGLMACIVAVGTAEAGGGRPGMIEVQDGKLTARIAGMPLQAVMDEVSRLAGIDVGWLTASGRDRAVSVEIIDLPLPEALRRILRGGNFLLVYTRADDRERLDQVWIDAAGGSSSQPIASLPTRPSRTGPARVQALPDNVELSIEGLAVTATADEDLISRLDAIESLGRHIQQEPRVRVILADLARHDASVQVRALAAATLGRLD